VGGQLHASVALTLKQRTSIHITWEGEPVGSSLNNFIFIQLTLLNQQTSFSFLHLSTSWCMSHPYTLPATQPHKLSGVLLWVSQEIPCVYGTARFTTMFTEIRHWFLFSTRWVQYTSHSTFVISIIILSSNIPPVIFQDASFPTF
jgi:hypothetical protein